MNNCPINLKEEKDCNIGTINDIKFANLNDNSKVIAIIQKNNSVRFLTLTPSSSSSSRSSSLMSLYPKTWNNIKYIYSNGWAFFSIDMENTLKSCGQNEYGGNEEDVKDTTDAIVTNDYAIAIILDDSDIYAFGNNKYGGDQLPDRRRGTLHDIVLSI